VILSSLAVEGTWYRSILPRALTLAHFGDALTHPLAAGSIRNSLLLSSAAVVASVIVGVAIARLLARSRVPGRFLLDALVMLPLAVPGLVLAFGYVSLSLHWPFSGPMPEWLDPIARSMLPTSWSNWLGDSPLKPIGDVLGANPNPMVLLIVAYAVRRLPYVVRAAVAGMEQTGVAVEEAAANLGAGRFTVLRRVVLPLIFANLLGGALLAFSFSMLEVSDSLILAQRERDYPITKAIYTLAERLGDGPAIASAMGVWGMALLTTTLLAATLLLGRRIGALFRA
jgi:iron(III) transport system permease protein